MRPQCFIGLAGMNDQRQAGCARSSDMGAESPLLRFAANRAGRSYPARLAQRHHFRMSRQLDQFVGRNSIFLIGVMRMGADRAIDVRKLLGDRQQPAETPHPRRDGDDAPDPGSGRSCDDGVEILGEIRKIEMAMAVDEHGVRTVQAAVGSI